MSAEAITPAQAEPLGKFILATSGLVTFDECNHPMLDKARQVEAVNLAHAIGRTDGTSPGVDEHTQNKVLPSEEFIRNAAESTMAHLGATVDQAIKKSREGIPLSIPAPPKPLTPWQKVQGWLSRNSLTALAIVAIGILEYVIGTAWTQRVFDLSDDTAHIVALMMPIIFGVVGFAIAHAVILTRESRVRRIIGISSLALVLGITATVICAGLVISGYVSDSSGDIGGVSGGLDEQANPTSDNSGYELVKFGVYVALLLSVTTLVMLLHLMDLWRLKLKQTKFDADAARTAPTSEQTASGNRAYLSQFLDVLDALGEARTDIIGAYIAGVRAILSPRIADDWNHDRLLVNPPDPAWVPELEQEIKRLEPSALHH